MWLSIYGKRCEGMSVAVYIHIVASAITVIVIKIRHSCSPHLITMIREISVDIACTLKLSKCPKRYVCVLLLTSVLKKIKYT